MSNLENILKQEEKMNLNFSILEIEILRNKYIEVNE